MIDRLNPFSSEFIENPYPIYKHYIEHDPVHWGISSDPQLPGAWYLFNYQDVVKVLEDNRFVRQAKHLRQDDQSSIIPSSYSKLQSVVSKWLVFQDPPTHTRLRSLSNKGLSFKKTESFRPLILKIANQLLDEVQNQGEMDLIEDFALPLPLKVITSILGVNTEDMVQFRSWTMALLSAQTSRRQRSNADLEQAEAATQMLIDYFTRAIAERRVSPIDDLITDLVKARDEQDQLSEQEVISMCIHLLSAGYETTVNLIGKGMLTLLRHPKEMEMLGSHSELIPEAIEELLRYDSPVHLVTRWASEDISISGKLIRRGDNVGLMIAAANRDPLRFPNPDVFDIHRNNGKHCVFGAGIHFCLGASLARTEGHIAFNVLFNRLSNLQLPQQKLEWMDSIVFHGLKHLRITFEAI
jgi:cytochrome P450 StaP